MRGDQISRRQVQKTRRFMNSFPNTIKFTGIPKMTVQARQINPKVTHLEQTVERNHCVWLIFCATHRSGTSENRFSKTSSRSECSTEGLHFTSLLQWPIRSTWSTSSYSSGWRYSSRWTGRCQNCNLQAEPLPADTHSSCIPTWMNALIFIKS